MNVISKLSIRPTNREKEQFVHILATINLENKNMDQAKQLPSSEQS